MRKMYVLVVGFALGLTQCGDDGGLGGPFGGATNAGSSNAGAGGARAGTGGGSGGLGRELCHLVATCIDGELRGTYGIACWTFSETCELGCRTSAMSFSYMGDDLAVALGFARSLCNQPAGDGGAGPVGDGVVPADPSTSTGD